MFIYFFFYILKNNNEKNIQIVFLRNSKWGINSKMQTLLTELDHGLSKSLRHSIDKNQGKKKTKKKKKKGFFLE